MARPAIISTASSPERLVVALATVLACSGGDAKDEGTSGLASADDSGGSSASGHESGDDGSGGIDCAADEVACGQTCADLDADPANCGACGISCVAANASATCTAGQCSLDVCDLGFANCDGNLENGCELAVACEADSACRSICGTPGTQTCNDPCMPICAPPDETCNAADDDCDRMCDEGPLPGCRAGVHRSNGATLGHFYTTDLAEATSAGLTLESQDYFFVYSEAAGGVGPLFRCMKPGGKRWLTSSIDCESTGAPELTLGFVAPDAGCGAMPLYRLYRAAVDDHFYTTSAGERDNAIAMFGYADQGIAGWVWPGA